MPPEPHRWPPPWEPFDHRGRPFLRATLPGPDPAGSAFVIAQPLAGRYHLEVMVAVGGDSVLIRGRDLRTGQPVMIKAIRPDALPPPPPEMDRPETWAAGVRHLRHLLQTERRLLVRLRNAGCRVVPLPIDYVYDRNPAWERPGLDDALIDAEPYLVLELIPGVTLEEVLATRYPEGMDEARALRLIWPIVGALRLLHEPWRLRSGRTWHCIYQDLKPANILLDPSGRPRLLDFGGCQVVIDGVPVLEGARTTGYSPPECEGAARVLLPCADVFTIGSTLYHMLTGIDPRERLARHRGRPGEHLDLRALPPGVSAAVRQVLRRCLAPRPSDRYADAQQVAFALTPLRNRTRELAPTP